MCFNKKIYKTIEPIQTLMSTPSHISQVQKLKKAQKRPHKVVKPTPKRPENDAKTKPK